MAQVPYDGSYLGTGGFGPGGASPRPVGSIPFDQPFSGYGAAPRATGGAPAAPPPPVEPPPWLKTAGGFSRMAKGVPTFARGAAAAGGAVRTVGGFAGKVIPGVSQALSVGGEGLGVYDTATDPNTSKLDVATRVAEGAGRLGAMGAGAGLGALGGGPVGAVVGGALGYVAPNAVYAARDYFQGRNTGAPGVDAPSSVMTPPIRGTIPSAVPVEAPPAGMSQEQMGQQNLRVAMSPQFAQPATPTNTAVPPAGTGFIRNNATGATTYLDSRGKGYGAAPVEPNYANNPAASFFQAGAKLKTIANTQAGDLARTKVGAEAAAKAAEAYQHIGAGNVSAATISLAQQVLANGGTPEQAAAAMKGRIAGGQFTVPMNAMPGKNGELPVLDRSKGTIALTTPRQKVTDQNINGYMRDNPGVTRAQAIAAHKDKGFDVSSVK